MLVLLAVLGLAGCGRLGKVERPTWRDAAARGARALEAVDGRQHRASQKPLKDAEVVALGYLERLRLGLGSPFRLVDHARQDPRLPPGLGATTVWALLHATAEGRTYQVDPRALREMGTDSLTMSPAAGALHLALVEETVRGADDPRAGELAARIAYRLAAAAHDVGPRAPDLADRVSALARDRELARRDALRLFQHAQATGRHPLDLAAAWRLGRRLEVEAPTAALRGADVQTEAARLAPALAERIRAIPARVARGEGASAAPPRSWLGEAAARRLGELAVKMQLPPRPPIAVALHHAAPHLRSQADKGEPLRAVERLLSRGVNEERFTAEYARMIAAGLDLRRLPLLAVDAAVGMRPYAQERPWFPGFPAPTAGELERRFGLRAVTFDREIPQGWRPFYRRMLADALEDFRLVLPNASLEGVRIRIGRTGRDPHVLATHDPATRTVRLPPERGAGAVGHELAHDLDWQLARRRYDRRGQYATDHAVRSSRRDRLAAAARGLPSTPVPGAGSVAEQERYAARPAELFARTFDGYLPALLAQYGRSNGALTAVQDGTLLGHGGAIPADPEGQSADAFLTLLDAASPLPTPRRAEFLRDWGSGRFPGALSLVQQVLEDATRQRFVPPPPRDTLPDLRAEVRRSAKLASAVGEVEMRRAKVARQLDTATCSMSAAALGPGATGEMRALLYAAAQARIRGIIRRTVPADQAVGRLGTTFAAAPHVLGKRRGELAASSLSRASWSWATDGEETAGALEPDAVCGGWMEVR